MNGAKIGGQLDCKEAALDGYGGEALDARRLRVTHGFFFRDLGVVAGEVDLTAAQVGDLVDDPTCWPVSIDSLILDDFTYDRLTGTAPTSLAARRVWLRAGSHWKGDFRPQPYTQFARVLRQMGHAGEARKVLIEREWLQGTARRAARWKGAVQDLPIFRRELWATIWNALDWVADRIVFLVAGYGQDARRSLVWLVGLLLLATTFAHLALEEGSFAPNSDVVLTSPGWAEATANDCSPVKSLGCEVNPADKWSSTFTTSADTPTQGADWDSFNRYGYAADLVVPFLDLGQTDAWAPSKDRGDWGKVLW